MWKMVNRERRRVEESIKMEEWKQYFMRLLGGWKIEWWGDRKE